MGWFNKMTDWLGFETVRNRDDKGRYIADDKSTPDVNEAYADGKTPKPKSTSTKPRNLRKPRKTRRKSKGSKNKK